jgi:TatD DNase family protein
VEFVDTHCHLDFNKFDNDRPEVILRAQAAGITRILIPGISVESSQMAAKLANSHPMLFSSIGIQPNDAKTWDEHSIEHLREIYLSSPIFKSSARKRILALGEIGLDYYWEITPHKHQKLVLWQQMLLAAELELPIILHLREKKDAEKGPCTDDLLEIITEWIKYLKTMNNSLIKHPGVLHSYSGDQNTARVFMELGFFIGVSGPVTFSNNKKRQDLIASLPLDKLLLETDAPFLTPHPNRGQRNEPANISFIAAKVSEIHKKTLAEVAEITCSNATRLFNW